ncbi:DUF3093 family protein [Tsukamurella soli]|uniref:DUF3093 domain-containing protein n=1 Tax=Tsukamurella soli TaxID=644556 RepID=A0ABP8J5A1_9ACTN
MSPETVYREQGVSVWWLAVAPILAVIVSATEIAVGITVHWWQWTALAVTIDLLVWLQVAGGRTHISVALTRDTLRCGNESLPVDRIAEILPGYAPDDVRRTKSAAEPERPEWMSARTLGQLPRVPRRRYPVGLVLADGETVQAWAKNDYALREALAPLLPTH